MSTGYLHACVRVCVCIRMGVCACLTAGWSQMLVTCTPLHMSATSVAVARALEVEAKVKTLSSTRYTSGLDESTYNPCFLHRPTVNLVHQMSVSYILDFFLWALYQKDNLEKSTSRSIAVTLY